MDEALQTGGTAPDIGILARQVLGAMIADPRKIPDGIGWGTASRPDKRPIYRVIVILGADNVDSTDAAVRALVVKPAPDVFQEDLDGPTIPVALPPKVDVPAAPVAKKKRVPRKRSYRPSRGSPH